MENIEAVLITSFRLIAIPEYCTVCYSIRVFVTRTEHARACVCTRVRARHAKRVYKIMSGALPYLYERRKFIVIALRARERARARYAFSTATAAASSSNGGSISRREQRVALMEIDSSDKK